MKEKKKRISKASPSYFLPLPYAMAARKLLSNEEMEEYLFEGLEVRFKPLGLINNTIAIVATINGLELVIAHVPNGMMTRVEGIMEMEEKIHVTIERLSCDQLASAFWICIDELPELWELGLNLG